MATMILDQKTRDEMVAELTKNAGSKVILETTTPGQIDVRFLRTSLSLTLRVYN